MAGALTLLLGMGGATITLEDAAVSDGIVPTSAFAAYALQSDGDIVKTEGATGTDLGDWIVPRAAAPGSYEVRATQNSGDTVTGTTGSWLALTSTRTWSLTQSGSGSKSANLTIEIRLGSVVLDSATVTLSVAVV